MFSFDANDGGCHNNNPEESLCKLGFPILFWIFLTAP